MKLTSLYLLEASDITTKRIEKLVNQYVDPNSVHLKKWSNGREILITLLADSVEAYGEGRDIDGSEYLDQTVQDLKLRTADKAWLVYDGPEKWYNLKAKYAATWILEAFATATREKQSIANFVRDLDYRFVNELGREFKRSAQAREQK